MNKPILSLFMCYRVRVANNTKAFHTFMKSLDKYFPDKSKIELLIKLDSDDKVGINVVKSYNLPYVKYFITHRWEGRWSMNYAYEYMFPYRNPNSKFIVFVGDDIYFMRDIIKNIEDNINNEYSILGDFKGAVTSEKLNKIDYHSKNWLDSKLGLICSYPIVSTKLIEIVGNFGYTPNMDSFLGLLNIIMYSKYKIILAKHIDEFVIRKNIDEINDYGRDFNQKNLITDSIITKDLYYFKLVEQQAKNIYLNMKAEGRIK